MALSEAQLYACYRRLEKPLYNVLYRWLWQPADCQDVIHDAFVRVWDRRDRVDAARLDALVWSTTLNLARNRLRWLSLRRFVHADEPATAVAAEPYEAALRSERDRRLRAALDTLSAPLRQVLLLAEFGGLNMAQIAQLLHIPAGTVGSRRHQALRRLRHLLEEHCDD